jgi:NADP-dependent 3-hydroxy acid dehydrogenase YdfG
MAIGKGKVAIITGASSGIGEATARKLVEAGYKLVLGARREDRLKAISSKLGDNVVYRRTDVTKKEDLEALAALALEKFGRIDVLVNNAGVMPVSLISSDKVDEWETMIDVNIKGVLYGIRAVLHHMLAQGSGHILTVASVAAFEVLPVGSVYSGTKAAVRAICYGLRQEVAGKVKVTTVYPGATETELTHTISVPEIRAAANHFMKDAISPDSIADGILYALSQPDNVNVSDVVIRPLAPHA